MNKIIKGAIIGIIGYEVCNFWLDVGKAHMLGTLLSNDVSAKECNSILLSSERPKTKFIAKLANIFSRD